MSAEPSSMEELAKRQLENHRVSGEGIGGVTTHFSCPFCGAPEWYAAKVLGFSDGDHPERTCSECGRTAQLLLTRDGDDVMIEVVQTGGPDQPEWMSPRMRDCRSGD